MSWVYAVLDAFSRPFPNSVVIFLKSLVFYLGCLFAGATKYVWTYTALSDILYVYTFSVEAFVPKARVLR